MSATIRIPVKAPGRMNRTCLKRKRFSSLVRAYALPGPTGLPRYIEKEG